MTNQKDAAIAENVGYTFWITDMGDMKDPVIACVKPGHLQLDGTWVQIIAHALPGIVNWYPYKSPSPFLSAPTFATDGIVLVWVQRQDSKYFFSWSRQYGKIAQKLNMAGTAFPRERFYKPGMYAQAVYALHEERKNGN